jgi:RNA polymerase sigma factor (sigma-70 family)
MVWDLANAQNTARPFVSRMLRTWPSDVEDVLQNAAVQAWVHRDQFKGDSKFSTWFTRIAINSALMFLRTRKREVALEEFREYIDVDETVFSIWETPEAFVIRLELEEMVYKRVHEAIDLLSLTRKTAALRWLDGKGAGTMAEKSARHQARIMLRKLLSKRRLG